MKLEQNPQIVVPYALYYMIENPSRCPVALLQTVFNLVQQDWTTYSNDIKECIVTNCIYNTIVFPEDWNVEQLELWLKFTDWLTVQEPIMAATVKERWTKALAA